MMHYQEAILDHFRNPRNYGKLKQSTSHARSVNPLCGDEIELDVAIKDGAVSAVKFSGKGCAISQASASMLTEYIDGKPVEELIKLNRDFMVKLTGIEVGPTRLKCLLLSLETLHKSINKNHG